MCGMISRRLATSHTKSRSISNLSTDVYKVNLRECDDHFDRY